MIDIERFNELKKEFGLYSSWTIWEQPKEKITDNIDKVDFFNDKTICNNLNDKYVFVGLNGSDTHGKQGYKPWKNFHSSYEHQKDYKLRYALTDTKFWGSYITDIIKLWKGDPEKAKNKDSGNFMSNLRKHPEIVGENIEIFKNELGTLSNEKPILIAIGKDSYKILKKNMKEYEIYRIRHYADFIGPENYKKEVQSVLEKI